MTAVPSPAATSVELGGGFIYVRQTDGRAAVFVAHLQSAGVTGMMTPKTVNARNDDELRRWLEGFGFDASRSLMRINQVHGTTIVEATDTTEPLEADGHWTDAQNRTLIVKVADCAPIWLADVESARFALVHAGWRGVAGGIITQTVEVLEAAGTDAPDLTVAIGPHLRPCCFEVGPEVAEKFSHRKAAVLPAQGLTLARQRDDSVALDLAAAVREELHALGVRNEQIFVATACTRCHEEFFHSYRRNGSGGPLMAAIAVGAK